MISRDSTLDEIKELVKECLTQLYSQDMAILRRNNGRGVCERSIVFRFAHYLQNRTTDYFVDCDFNSSFEFSVGPQGVVIAKERDAKPIQNTDGSVTPRFVDIIVHKRDHNVQSNLICFEIKKWNNTRREEVNKDKNNLRVMTSRYGYIYGFQISLHKERAKTKWTIFKDGRSLEGDAAVFEGASA